MMAKKTFVVSVGTHTVDPESHQIRAGDEIEWTIDKGKAFVVFEPDGSGPIMFLKGPSFDSEMPALAKGQETGTFPFSVCCWYEQEGRKDHEALQAVLIIDP